jgi:hypothetical protein
MKQIGSVITGTAMAKAWSTGEQPGATGSGAQLPTNVATHAPSIMVPAELQTIMQDSVLHWMALPPDTMPMNLEQYGLEVLDEAAQALAHAQAGVEHALPLVSKEKMANVIGSMAEMLQVSVPSTAGLKLYFHALKDLPAYKFEAAALKLIKTHKWPRLPLPADFIEAAKEERQDIESFALRLSIARTRVEGARKLLHQRSK